jgi:hypothetical protein
MFQRCLLFRFFICELFSFAFSCSDKLDYPASRETKKSYERASERNENCFRPSPGSRFRISEISISCSFFLLKPIVACFSESDERKALNGFFYLVATKKTKKTTAKPK